MRRGSRIGVALAALLGAAAEEAIGAGRSPDIRVRLRIADDAVAGTGDSVRDVREILREGKGPDGLVEAPPEGETDLMLVVTHRASGIFGAARRSGDPSGGNISYVLQGLLVDGRRTTPVTGRGIVWRQAALELLEAVGSYAEDARHPLLRRRADWPAVGFEFEALTKEHQKEIGAKGGAVVVTEVAPAGPAASAGLRAGDAIAKAGGRKIDSAGDLARALYAAEPGAFPLEVARDGGRRAVSVMVP